MQLVTFQDSGVQKLGALYADGCRIADLAAAHTSLGRGSSPALVSMQALIEAGTPALDLARLALEQVVRREPAGCSTARADVRLLAPLPQPVQLRDFLCFEEHWTNGIKMAIEMARLAPDPEAAMRELQDSGYLEVPAVFYEHPLYYTCNRFSVVGPDADVRWPAYSKQLDYELEFAAIIGTRGVDIPLEKARDHIFGYTIFNDISARDTQARDMELGLGPGKGKDFDTGNVLGPCIVTSDELGDPYSLTMLARINGEEWSRGHSSTITYRFEDCIAHLSQGVTLHPGEILASGTVGGGCGAEQNRYPKAGDVIELEVERIGVLRNRIVQA